jgi:4-cresol dehydrogenase (hydroxylating)
MSEAVANRGVFVGRAPIDYHDFHMKQTVPSFQAVCSGIKRAVDPNGVIAPGRYGITL